MEGDVMPLQCFPGRRNWRPHGLVECTGTQASSCVSWAVDSVHGFQDVILSNFLNVKNTQVQWTNSEIKEKNWVSFLLCPIPAVWSGTSYLIFWICEMGESLSQHWVIWAQMGACPWGAHCRRPALGDAHGRLLSKCVYEGTAPAGVSLPSPPSHRAHEWEDPLPREKQSACDLMPFPPEQS